MPSLSTAPGQGGSAQLVHLTWVDPSTPLLPSSLFLDCSVNENHMTSAIVTTHNVEAGLPVTDYIRPMPARLSINGIVTNTPLTAKATQFGILTPNASQLANTYVQYTQPSFNASPTGNLTFDIKTTVPAPRTVPIVGFQWLSTDTTAQNGGFDDVSHAFLDLVEAITNGWLFSIDTTLCHYDNMAATSFNVPRDQNNTDSIQFTIEFQEIRMVQTTTADVPVRKKVKHGPKKAPTQETFAETLKKKSIVASLGDAASAALGN